MKTESLLNAATKSSGVTQIGLIRKTALIRHGIGASLSDIQGWDIISKGKDGSCFSYYVAQAPLIGMSAPQPIACPLGIVAFDNYKIDIEEAIKIFKTQNGGDKFTSVTLCWPLVYPEALEPHWYFRTNLGNDVIIGANSGIIGMKSPIVVLYMAQPE